MSKKFRVIETFNRVANSFEYKIQETIYEHKWVDHRVFDNKSSAEYYLNNYGKKDKIVKLNKRD